MLAIYVCLHIIGKTTEENHTNTLIHISNASNGTTINKRVAITKTGVKMDLCVGTATVGKSVNTILMYIERVNVKQKIAKIFIVRITTHPKNNDKKWVNILNYFRDVELQTFRQLIIIPCSITRGRLNPASQVLRLLHLHLLHRRPGQEFMLLVLRTGPQGMEVFNLKLLTQVVSKIICPWRLNLSYLQV